MCALGVAVLSAILYGVELWPAHGLLGVVCRGVSLYHVTCFTPVLAALKYLAGLPSSAFSAPVYCLFQLPTVFESVLPRLVCLVSTLSMPVLEGLLVAVAAAPSSLLAALLALVALVGVTPPC